MTISKYTLYAIIIYMKNPIEINHDFNPIQDNNHQSEDIIKGDYGNEYHVLGATFRMGGFNAVKDLLSKSGIYKNQPDFYMQKYEDRAKIYGYPLSDKNKDKRDRINELADQMNILAKNPKEIDEDNFRKIYDELDSIIYRENESNLPKKEH